MMPERSDLLPDDDGSTPIDPDELDDLIPPHIDNKAELNQWEAVNIARARDWVQSQQGLEILSVEWLKELHRRMFDQTWKWAGAFRRTDTNISPFPWTEVPILVRELVANTHTQYELSDQEPSRLDETGTRFHHRLVLIHPWVNGNGRHARLATDALLVEWGRPAFSWGSGANLIASGESRKRYLNALRSADGGSYSRLMEFVRS